MEHCHSIRVSLRLGGLLTLLSFSPSWWGNRVRRLWNPALMLCIRRLSLELAISRRIRRSWSTGSPPVKSLSAKLMLMKLLNETAMQCATLGAALRPEILGGTPGSPSKFRVSKGFRSGKMVTIGALLTWARPRPTCWASRSENPAKLGENQEDNLKKSLLSQGGVSLFRFKVSRY